MIRRVSQFALMCLLLSVVAVGAHAQLQGNDTSPGDSCASFPEGAARMTASPSGDGTHITLICNGATWEMASDSFIEHVPGLSAPPYGLSCTQRTDAGTGANTRTVSCLAGEIMTGGGCTNTGTLNVRRSFPSAANIWTCDMSGTTGTTTAYAICCSY